MPRTARTDTLSQIQRLIVEGATRHPERRLTRPETVKPSTYRSAVQALRRRGLLAEGPETKGTNRPAGSVLTLDAVALLGLKVLAPIEEAAATERVAARVPRPGTKQALVVTMLMRTDGANIAELIAATGWLPHTTRAALTVLRKRGFAIETVREAGAGTLYRLGDAPVINRDGGSAATLATAAPNTANAIAELAR